MPLLGPLRYSTTSHHLADIYNGCQVLALCRPRLPGGLRCVRGGGVHAGSVGVHGSQERPVQPAAVHRERHAHRNRVLCVSLSSFFSSSASIFRTRIGGEAGVGKMRWGRWGRSGCVGPRWHAHYHYAFLSGAWRAFIRAKQTR